jgi:hypothetical protein
MKSPTILSYALDPSLIMRAMGKKPDPWQKAVLNEKEHLLLNCHRQAGKSTIIGVKACHRAVFFPKSTVVIISKTQRQAGESFRKFLDAYYAIGAPVAMTHDSQLFCELENKSRVISLPGREDTIRGYSAVDLLIIDEASRVPDFLYAAVRPMVAISRGQIACLSTPFGQRGFFWREWKRTDHWKRIQVSADQCPRFTKEYLEAERLALGDNAFAQEYMCSFVAIEGLVYPNFKRCLIDTWPDPKGRKIGGIDWGWRNPFAAVWGIHDQDTDILYIQAERYASTRPLAEHRDALKKVGGTWYADPSGPTEIAEFRAAGISVFKGNNALEAGIAAVTARIDSDRLKIYAPNCPNVIDEGETYRYPDRREYHPEPTKPIDEHNHAWSAIRYLISKLDVHFMARYRFREELAQPLLPRLQPQQHPAERIGPDFNDPNIWTTV